MRHLFAALLLCIAQMTFAQNVNIQFFPPKYNNHRTEIVIPDAEYQVFKADLHIHTMFSDGQVWPTFRVQEAWRDGLDVIAMTDHIEYLPNKQYLNADLNTSYEIARPEAEKMGIILIHGAEITRKQGVIGHFNAIFINDANLLNVEDPKAALVAARAQGAFITFNHPAWTMDTCKFSPFQKEVLDEGLIDGIEAVNNHEYYARALSWCIDLKKTLISASDAHDVISNSFKIYTAGPENVRCRPMTLVYARERTEASFREALESRRTLGFFDGKVIGDKELLQRLFTSCVSFVKVGANDKSTHYNLTNVSSLPFKVKIKGKEYRILPMSSIALSFPNGTSSVDVTVLNMYYYENAVPTFTLAL
ncbi:MAG: PHP domain-containing protein [Bacteroidales bacterium]|nr:PHP domain-containing protein [Bacteroidales bacterium]